MAAVSWCRLVGVASLLLAMLGSGAGATILAKSLYSLWSIGVDGSLEQFTRPWFNVFVMFAGMAFVGFVDGCARCARHRCLRQARSMAAEEPESQPPERAGGYPAKKTTRLRKWLFFAAPAAANLVAAAFANFGLLSVPGSVYQMLRGTSMVFAALFSVALLGKTMHSHHWLGLGVCVAGVFLVGIANLLSADISSIGGGGEQQAAVGMTLVIIAQVFEAVRVILEEYAMKEMHIPAMQVIGGQGVWGLAMTTVAYLGMYPVPGHDHGHLTDWRNEVSLLDHSQTICAVSAAYFVFVSSQNASGIGVTAVLSGVHRKILDGMRSAVVWAFGLYVYYFVDKSSELGQGWTPYSRLELLGFTFLIFGQLAYGGVLQKYVGAPRGPSWKASGTEKSAKGIPVEESPKQASATMEAA